MNIATHIAEAEQYRTIITGAIATIAPVYEPAVIAAIMSRESGCGLLLKPPGPGGKGDRGHGHGLMQIDDRWHEDWIRDNPWDEPATNIGKGIMILHDIVRQVGHYAKGKHLKSEVILRVAIAGYNCGGWNAWNGERIFNNPDRHTTGGNYSADVLDRAAQFRDAGW